MTTVRERMGRVREVLLVLVARDKGGAYGRDPPMDGKRVSVVDGERRRVVE